MWLRFSRPVVGNLPSGTKDASRSMAYAIYFDVFFVAVIVTLMSIITAGALIKNRFICT